MTGETLTAFAVIPATYRLSENTRINVNAGWLWDRTVDRHYLTYGVGFDWKFTDVLQWDDRGVRPGRRYGYSKRGAAAFPNWRALPAQ